METLINLDRRHQAIITVHNGSDHVSCVTLLIFSYSLPIKGPLKMTALFGT